MPSGISSFFSGQTGARGSIPSSGIENYIKLSTTGRSASPYSALSELMKIRAMMTYMQDPTGSGLRPSSIGGFRLSGGTKLTAKERQALLDQAHMQQAQNAIYNNEEFRQRYQTAMQSSAAKAQQAVKDMREAYIKPTAAQFGVDAGKLSDIMMGQLSAETKQRVRDVKEGQLSYAGQKALHGLTNFFTTTLGNAIPFFRTEAEREAASKRAIEESKAIDQNNAYGRDQLLRQQEGEGFFDLGSGETGSYLANMAEMIGENAPAIAATLTPAGIVGAAGNALRLGAAGLNALRTGALMGAGAGVGAAMSSEGFRQRVFSDPNLSPEQQRAALESPEATANTALGAALGGIPFGAEGLWRMAAPRIPFTAAGRRVAADTAAQAAELTAARAAVPLAEREAVLDAGRRAALEAEAQRQAYQTMAPTFLSRAGQQARWMVPEVAAMNVGQTAGSNILYGGATGQDVPWTEGLGEAVASSIPLGLLGAGMSAASMGGRARTNFLRNFRDDGTPKITNAQLARTLNSRINNGTLGDVGTLDALRRFRADWGDEAAFADVLAQVDPQYHDMLGKVYNLLGKSDITAKDITAAFGRRKTPDAPVIDTGAPIEQGSPIIDTGAPIEQGSPIIQTGTPIEQRPQSPEGSSAIPAGSENTSSEPSTAQSGQSTTLPEPASSTEGAFTLHVAERAYDEGTTPRNQREQQEQTAVANMRSHANQLTPLGQRILDYARAGDSSITAEHILDMLLSYLRLEDITEPRGIAAAYKEVMGILDDLSNKNNHPRLRTYTTMKPKNRTLWTNIRNRLRSSMTTKKATVNSPSRYRDEISLDTLQAMRNTLNGSKSSAGQTRTQGVGGDVARREAAGTASNPATPGTVAPVARDAGTQTAEPAAPADTTAGRTDESGRPGGAEAQNVGQGEVAVPPTEQAGAQPVAEGANRGRGAEPAAEGTSATGEGTGGTPAERGGGENIQQPAPNTGNREAVKAKGAKQPAKPRGRRATSEDSARVGEQVRQQVEADPAIVPPANRVDEPAAPVEKTQEAPKVIVRRNGKKREVKTVEAPKTTEDTAIDDAVEKLLNNKNKVLEHHKKELTRAEAKEATAIKNTEYVEEQTHEAENRRTRKSRKQTETPSDEGSFMDQATAGLMKQARYPALERKLEALSHKRPHAINFDDFVQRYVSDGGNINNLSWLFDTASENYHFAGAENWATLLDIYKQYKFNKFEMPRDIYDAINSIPKKERTGQRILDALQTITEQREANKPTLENTRNALLNYYQEQGISGNKINSTLEKDLDLLYRVFTTDNIDTFPAEDMSRFLQLRNAVPFDITQSITENIPAAEAYILSAKKDGMKNITGGKALMNILGESNTTKNALDTKPTTICR